MGVPVRSIRSSSGPKAVISLVLLSTTRWPRTTPVAVSNAAGRCIARASGPRAPRAVLPSTAITGRSTSALLWDARAVRQRHTARSSAWASRRRRTLRIVDSHAEHRRRPSRRRTVGVRSCAHCAIAVQDRAPANTAHTAIPSTALQRCRTPRRARGSTTAASTGEQVGRDRSQVSPRHPALVNSIRDHGQCRHGHSTRLVDDESLGNCHDRQWCRERTAPAPSPACHPTTRPRS